MAGSKKTRIATVNLSAGRATVIIEETILASGAVGIAFVKSGHLLEGNRPLTGDQLREAEQQLQL
jgi:hypothetical protein